MSALDSADNPNLLRWTITLMSDRNIRLHHVFIEICSIAEIGILNGSTLSSTYQSC